MPKDEWRSTSQRRSIARGLSRADRYEQELEGMADALLEKAEADAIRVVVCLGYTWKGKFYPSKENPWIDKRSMANLRRLGVLGKSGR